MTSFRQLVSVSLSVLAGLAAAGAPTGAEAHPHIFVDAKFEAVAGADGSLAEVRDTWRFDEVFSSSVLLDYDKNRNNTLDPAEVAAVAKTVQESLDRYNYYTNVTINGKSLALAKPDALHGTYENGYLTLSFSQKPVQKTPLKGLIVFGVFDPTLYTALDFSDDAALKTSGNSFGHCARKVVRPDSKEILAENQAMLTTMFFSDPMGSDYSQIVATRLEVRC
ncbi:MULTISPECIES: DUF1007 family protein [unclassified Neorhizobium]|uniref:DUF1007 family protein n=1 Tax=unclassified Neorhizobium TaxID=2629175 RepID=UPI001FF5816A|nr:MULTISPECIES: DUF1007 family protein [unclassified Neorhizobium]MCJ9668831.1 DUF1007 family protein [Neorhizobium sp. SHOUNA12B]MCJ9744637.1 DUF1007 family protein [Neorhizobium sp. SHOUNA12A]